MLNDIAKLFHPLYHVLAYLLVFWYGIVPNYAVAIALFTVTVMVVLAPLTVKSTRSMLAMQVLQPEMQRLRDKYKSDRLAMQAEVTDLFKRNGVSPLGGCVPMFIQLPVFFVLYRMIAGLTRTTHEVVHGVTHVVAQPQYISSSSLLYKNLVAGHGSMLSFGMNFAKSATGSHSSFAVALPFYGLLLVCIALQFFQMHQISSRAPQQTGAAATTQKAMKYMPLIMGVIYLAIPAGVNVYFFVSSLFRIGQQELMYRCDGQVKRHLASVREAAAKVEAKGANRVVRSGPADLSGERLAGSSTNRRGARPEVVGANGRDNSNGAAAGEPRRDSSRGVGRARPPQLRAKAASSSPGRGPEDPERARPVRSTARAAGARTTATTKEERGTEKPGQAAQNGKAAAQNGKAAAQNGKAAAQNGKAAAQNGKAAADARPKQQSVGEESSWARRPRVAAPVGGASAIREEGSDAEAVPLSGKTTAAAKASNRARAKRQRRAR